MCFSGTARTSPDGRCCAGSSAVDRCRGDAIASIPLCCNWSSRRSFAPTVRVCLIGRRGRSAVGKYAGVRHRRPIPQITEPPRFLRRRFSWFQAAMLSPDAVSWKPLSASAGGICPIGPRRRRWLNQSTHLRVSHSTASAVLQDGRRWITSALNRPMIVSASALKLLYLSSGHVHARRCAEMAIDFPDDVPFEAPDDLALSLAVGRAFGDVGSCRGMTPHPNDGDAVERRIRLS
jgi:hypothetical protein